MGTNAKSNRELSRGSYIPAENTWEMVNAGSLQRIADATEKMAQRHTELINERDRYKLWYDKERDSHAGTVRQLRAARGLITKLRKQLAVAGITKEPPCGT